MTTNYYIKPLGEGGNWALPNVSLMTKREEKEEKKTLVVCQAGLSSYLM
jgi:hypothetical protein